MLYTSFYFCSKTFKEEIVVKEFTEERESLLQRLNTDLSAGLTTEQAIQSQSKHGSNTITREKRQSL